MLIIPAIDLIDGRCVRLSQGDYGREKTYSEDPVKVAQGFATEGAEWLHVVDLDGAKAGKPNPKNLAIVQEIASHVDLKVELGGGITGDEAVEAALAAGVSRVVLGSALVKSHEFAARILKSLGERVVAGIDARGGMVAVSGWLETSEITAKDMAMRVFDLGAKRIILTDIARDGMLTGPNMVLFGEVASAVPIPIVQSGGIATLDDIVALAEMPAPRAEGVIVGRAIYEGKFTVREALSVV